MKRYSFSEVAPHGRIAIPQLLRKAAAWIEQQNENEAVVFDITVTTAITPTDEVVATVKIYVV
jgi:hypothetical protein